MNGENDFKICKLKSYRMIPLREVKNSSYRFNLNSKFKHLLGTYVAMSEKRSHFVDMELYVYTTLFTIKFVVEQARTELSS